MCIRDSPDSDLTAAMKTKKLRLYRQARLEGSALHDWLRQEIKTDQEAAYRFGLAECSQFLRDHNGTLPPRAELDKDECRTRDRVFAFLGGSGN